MGSPPSVVPIRAELCREFPHCGAVLLHNQPTSRFRRTRRLPTLPPLKEGVLEFTGNGQPVERPGRATRTRADSPPDIWPEGFAQHKLYRLLELRAVIDAMRCEGDAQDPLLAWVTAHEQHARFLI